jgi:hypothetical protein
MIKGAMHYGRTEQAILDELAAHGVKGEVVRDER